MKLEIGVSSEGPHCHDSQPGHQMKELLMIRSRRFWDKRRATPGKPRNASTRPRFETLEDRTVLSSFTNTPADIQQAYGINDVQFSVGNQVFVGNGAGQTIALLEDGIDQNIVGDLQQFDNLFTTPGLILNDFDSYDGQPGDNGQPWFNAISLTGPDAPAIASASACGEIALDIEWAHSIAPLANILDVQFGNSNDYDVGAAAQFAAEQPGVTVVSTSWSTNVDQNSDYCSPVVNTVGQTQNVTFLSASGDKGAFNVPGPNGQQQIIPNADGPADQPNVIAVGGTVLSTNADGSYGGETGWGFPQPFTTDSSPTLGSYFSGTWTTVNSGGFDGSYNVGSGEVYATWDIPITSSVADNIGATDVTKKDLELSATWPGVSGASTDAEYQFWDETTATYLGSIEVNQSIASNGVPDGNGSFQELGLLSVGGMNPQLNIGDTLEVVLVPGSGSLASGTEVADTIGLGHDSASAGGLSLAQYSPGTLAFQASVSPSQTYRAYPDVSLIGGSFVPIVQSYDPGGGASIQSATESGNTVTITTSGSNGIAVGDLVDIAGVAVSGYDGTYFTVTSVCSSNNSFIYQDNNDYNLPNSSGGTANNDIGYFTGTSLATPCWAGLIAIADQGLALNGRAPLDTSQALAGLYSLPSFDFNKETSGYNGYQTTTGYNLVTGLGSPIANQLILALDDTVAQVSGPINYAAPEGQGTNNLKLTLDPFGNIDLYNNGLLVDSMPAALTSGITIYGAGAGTGNNLTIDFGGGNPIPSAGAEFIGGGSAGNNTLNLENGNFGLDSYAPSGTNSGSVSFDDGIQIFFQDVSTVNDATAVTAFNSFAFFDRNTADAINVQNGPDFDGYQTTEINSSLGDFAPINFANKTIVAIFDTSSGGGDTFTINNPTPEIDMTSIDVYTSMNGNGSTVNVEATPAFVTIWDGAADTVDLGRAGNVNSVEGQVSLEAATPTAYTTLIVDDSNDTQACLASLYLGELVLNSTTVVWGGYGLIKQLSVYGGAGFNTWNVYDTGFGFTTHVYTGTGGAKVNVRGTTSSLKIDNEGGTVNVVIGSNAPQLGGTLATIVGTVDVFGAGSTQLTLDDSGDAAVKTVTMTKGKIEGLEPADIEWTASSSPTGGVTSLSVYGGSGGNIYYIDGTGDFFGGTYLETGASNSSFNSVYVEATSAPSNGSVGTLEGSLTVDGGDDGQLVTVGNNGSLAGIKGAVQVLDSGSGFSYLMIDDSADSKGRNATLSDGMLTGLANQAPITWDDGSSSSNSGGVEYVQIEGGAAADSFTVTNTGDLYTPPGSQFTTQLLLGVGNNKVNVQATTGGLDIEEGLDATVTIGSTSNMLDTISGAVHINGGGDGRLTINDQGTAAARAYDVTDSLVTCGTAAIWYTNQGKVTINGSTAASRYDIDSTAAAMIVNAGAGGNSFVIGPTNENFGEIGPLTLNSGGSGNSLAVEDQNDASNDTYTISAGSIQRTNSAGLKYTGIGSVLINGSASANVTYNVNSTATGTYITLNAGSGASTINVTPGSESLNSIAGLLTVSAGSLSSIVSIDDQNAPNSENYTITSSSVTRPSTAGVDYRDVQMDLYGGRHGNTIDLESTSSSNPVTVFPGSGTNITNIGNSDTLDDILSPPAIEGQGGKNTVNVDDQDNTALGQYSLNAGALYFRPVTSLADPPVIYTSDINSLVLNAGQGGNTFAINSTATGTSYTVNGGTAGATFNVGGLGTDPLGDIEGALTLNGQDTAFGGTYVINFNDQNASSVETYTLGNSTLARTGMATITYTGEIPYSSINVYMGSAKGDVIDVKGTAGNTTDTYIDGGGDNDQYNVLATDPDSELIVSGSSGTGNLIRIGSMSRGATDTAAHNGTLANIRGSEIEIGSFGACTAVVDDSGDTSADPDVSYVGTAIFGLAPSELFLNSVAPLDIYGGSGNNVYNVTGLIAGAPPETLYTGAGADIVNVSVLADVYDFGLNVVGQGKSEALNVNDQPLTDPASYVINSSSVVRTTGSGSTTRTLTLSYQGISSLTMTGGSGGNVFALQGNVPALTSLNGGGAGQDNWLDYSAFTTAVTVNLTTGSATDIDGGAAGAFSNIQNIYGGSGGSTLTGDSQGNVLVGGSGDDIIKGGTGRSILIGDGSAGQITGGSTNGGDILIGGTTSYDADTASSIAALDAILAEWQSSASYSARFSAIDDGLPGGYSLHYGTTVQGDSSANVLTGAAYAAAIDWFFAGPDDTLVNQVPGEYVNNKSQ
jgi:hypothetical protein